MADDIERQLLQDIKPETLATSNTVQTCSGDCFSLASIFNAASSSEPYKDNLPNTHSSTSAGGGSKQPASASLYEPLGQGQARLICIAPSADDLAPLEVDLVVGELTFLQGIRLAGQQAVTPYTALSYCWHVGNGMTTMSCNGRDMPVSVDVLEAIKHHRRSDEAVYLWIDAICINQEHMAEKEEQVAIMLDIYMQASAVTAWLGPASLDSSLALQCLSRCPDLPKKLNAAINKKVTHSTACEAVLQTVYNALLCLYERPYLSRTWIRQETYIPRKINVVCGAETLSWRTYLSGRDWLAAIHEQLHIEETTDRYQSALILLDEAKTSLRTWMRPGSARPRDIFDVLIRTASYGVTNENDSVFAILRMCGIRSTPRSQYHNTQELAMAVDYSQTPDRTYHEMTKYLLVKEENYRRTVRMLWIYHAQLGSHQRCYEEGEVCIPTWVMNWRTLRCSNQDVSVIDAMLRSDQDVIDQCTRESAIVEANVLARAPRVWCTHWSLRTRGIQGVVPFSRDSAWRLEWTDLRPQAPFTLEENGQVLLLSARAINYVAYVSEYTCPLELFKDLCPEHVLGRAAGKIHVFAEPETDCTLFRVHPADLFEPYDALKHNRKIAILGLGLDAQLALVPASTQKGDIVVAIGDTLPLVLTPAHINTYKDRLYQTPDPYEEHVWCAAEAATKPDQGWHTPYMHPAASSNSRCGTRARTIRACMYTWPGFVLCFSIIPSVFLLLPLIVIVSLIPIGTMIIAIGFTIAWLEPFDSVVPHTDASTMPIEKQVRNFTVLDTITEEHDAHYRLQGPVFASQLGIWREFYLRTPVRPVSSMVIERPVQTFHIH